METTETTKPVTAEEVRAMDISEIIERLERVLGPIDSGTMLSLAMLHGSSRGGGPGVMVIDLEGPTRTESMNYDKVAEVMNREPRKEAM